MVGAEECGLRFLLFGSRTFVLSKTDASAMSIHSFFSRSTTILGLATSILRRFFRSCVTSDKLVAGFLILGRRGVSADFVGDFGCFDGHSHVSGGCHEYCTLPLGDTDHPSSLIETSSRKTGVADISVSWELGTGNSKVSDVEGLSSQRGKISEDKPLTVLTMSR